MQILEGAADEGVVAEEADVSVSGGVSSLLSTEGEAMVSEELRPMQILEGEAEGGGALAVASPLSSPGSVWLCPPGIPAHCHHGSPVGLPYQRNSPVGLSHERGSPVGVVAEEGGTSVSRAVSSPVSVCICSQGSLLFPDPVPACGCSQTHK